MTLKILYFDIETSPCLAEVWGCGKQYVSAEQIRKERKIICIAYKFAGENKTYSLKMNIKKHKILRFDDDADKEMLKKFIKIYNSADMVVAHNGRKFDLARLRARLVRYELPDLAPVLFDDSYVFSKDKNFTSHKLDYLCKYLDMPGKTHTSRKLWTDVMEGSQKALDELTEYCENDVVILEKVYNRLRPYCKSKINLALHFNDAMMCPSCGGNLEKRGVYRTRTAIKQRFQCKKCGSWCHNGQNLITETGELPR